MSKLNKYIDIYNKEVELPGTSEKVTISPLTTNKMKELLLYENETDPIEGEIIIDKVIKSAVVNENFSIDNIFIQDKYFLFFEIRKLTKGDFYQFKYTCPKCNSESIQNINLNDLIVNQKMPSDSNEIKILNDKLSLKMKHITRGEQKEAYDQIKNIENDNQKRIEMVLSTLSQSIEEITTEEGVDDSTLKEKIDFVGNLPENEYNKIND